MKIAIVGGGASGTAVFDNLVREKHKKLDITIYEPSQHLGPGQAYRLDAHSALLNRPASFMSLRADEPHHFVFWLQEHKVIYNVTHNLSEQFLPRSVFGEYLKDTFQKNLKRARHNGCHVAIVHDLATEISQREKQLSISTSRGDKKNFDCVVLSPGTGRTENPYNLNANELYIDDPYPLNESLKSVSPHKNVLILGTGLTAIDIFLYLRENSHTGDIILASRRGLLPTIRYPEIPFYPKHFTQENFEKILNQTGRIRLEDVSDLAILEFEQQGISLQKVKEILFKKENPQIRLFRQLEEIQNGSLIEPILRKMAFDTTETIWNGLADEEKDSFLKTYHHIFNSVRNPMPPQTAEKLLNAINEGSVKILSEIENIEQEKDGKYIVHFKEHSVKVDSIINAIRSETGDESKESAPLIQSLIDQKIGIRNKFGGIKSDFKTNQILSPEGKPYPNIYALGQITQGDRYYTSSLERCSKRAKIIVDEIFSMQNLQKDSLHQDISFYHHKTSFLSKAHLRDAFANVINRINKTFHRSSSKQNSSDQSK